MVKGQAPLVRDWLKALPTAVWHTYPYLYLLYALDSFFANEWTTAERHLTAAEEQLDPEAQDDDKADGGRWSVRNGTFCTFYDTINGGCWHVLKRSVNCY